MKRLLIILTVLMSSCEMIIDIDVPYDRQKIVVNAVQHPDSLWYVDLSGTNYILDSRFSFDPITSANVVIHKPDGSTEKLIEKVPYGVYYGNSRPQPGSNYKITVERDGYPSVEGQMKMPSVVDIIDIEWDSAHAEAGNGTVWGGQELHVPFKITLADPGGINNYYDVNVYLYVIQTRNQYPDNVLVVDTTRMYMHTYLRDPGISDDEQSEFTDRTFDGETVTIPFISEFVIWNGGRHYKTEVWLTNSSEELFKYEKTRQLQSEVDGDPFAQPVQVFSNMSNGFGIFGGMTADVETFMPREQP